MKSRSNSSRHSLSRFATGALAFVLINVAIIERPAGADVVGEELPPAKWSSLHISVEVKPGPLVVGSDVPVKIILTNAGAIPMKIHVGSPWSSWSTQLWLTKSDGSIVQPNGHSNIGDALGTERFILDPAQSFVLSWLGNSWSGLSNWGYKIDEAGSYTIHVRAHALGFNFPTMVTDGTDSEADAAFIVQSQNLDLGKPAESWGPRSGNLQISISTQKIVFEAGRSIPVSIHIRNFGPTVLIDRDGTPYQYRVMCGKAPESDGCVRRLGGLRCTLNFGGGTDWQLDQNGDYRVTIDITTLYDIAPGSYSLKLESPIRLTSVTGPLPSDRLIADLYSNAIQITVVRPQHVPRNPCNPTAVSENHAFASDFTIRSNDPGGRTSDK